MFLLQRTKKKNSYWPFLGVSFFSALYTDTIMSQFISCVCLQTLVNHSQTMGMFMSIWLVSNENWIQLPQPMWPFIFCECNLKLMKSCMHNCEKLYNYIRAYNRIWRRKTTGKIGKKNHSLTIGFELIWGSSWFQHKTPRATPWTRPRSHWYSHP